MVEPLVLAVAAVIALVVLVFLWKMIKFGVKVGMIVGVGLLLVWALRQAGLMPGAG